MGGGGEKSSKMNQNFLTSFMGDPFLKRHFSILVFVLRIEALDWRELFDIFEWKKTNFNFRIYLCLQKSCCIGCTTFLTGSFRKKSDPFEVQRLNLFSKCLFCLTFMKKFSLCRSYCLYNFVCNCQISDYLCILDFLPSKLASGLYIGLTKTLKIKVIWRH